MGIHTELTVEFRGLVLRVIESFQGLVKTENVKNTEM